MENTALWLEQGYCSNCLTEVRLQTKNVTLELPIQEVISEYDICRFKLIFEEVKNEKQLLLGSEVLGEKIVEEIYKDVLFEAGDFVCYEHDNHLNSFVNIENETVEKAIKEGVLRTKNNYRKDDVELSGEYNIKVQIFRQGIKQPSFVSSESPRYLTDYEQKIDTITIYVLAFKSSTDIKNNNELVNTSVYGSFSSLGFFMVDLELFGDFIRREVGGERINLVDLFTTTDLVDKCFDEGLLMITWGIQPWHYYIQAMNNSITFDECIVSGTYKIKKEIKELSVIPGDELLMWPECLDKEWPTIRLEGSGEKVELSLHTWSGKLGNELIPMYLLQRSEEKVESVEPIINYSFL